MKELNAQVNQGHYQTFQHFQNWKLLINFEIDLKAILLKANVR